MIYAFGDCEMDIAARELRRGGIVVRLEPQVFDLLGLLVENRHRVVGREELIERIWHGRAVSDAAVSSRVKSARQAVGDDGERQGVIRTHHGVGFRFVGTMAAPSAMANHCVAVGEARERAASARPSIAVLPFELVGAVGAYAAVADGLPHDLILELSRLHWLTVIARGSSFQFRSAAVAPEKVAAALGVRYVVTGDVEVDGPRISVTVEVSDTSTAALVWSERYGRPLGAVHEIRSEIASSVASALDLHIAVAEARRALSSPSNLDAWAAYHLGVAEMYRFDREGAERAAARFEQAIEREPGFARAHAGLSFAHFQGAFQRFAADRAAAIDKARRSAETAVALDPFDPFCNLVTGRVAWLIGDLEGARPWLDRAIELNPNYAQGKYASAWTRTLLGEGSRGRRLVDAAMELSPLDPLLYAMLAVRAFTHILQGETAEAAIWGERAARAPRAHPLIELIAAVSHGLNGDDEQANRWFASALRRQPDLGREAFFEAFPFGNDAVRVRINQVLHRIAV
ncbi:winged helix-turn-helix domain-containing tetratricopeptide repeat protein [Phreatobacter stygius]|uniref:Tetratricopeptide repeat protein n=1 Tax=Phreatobacter stygius TaxID=1940610 RepID=A0A4D7B912_9HYPH|nr:winged helix-turn-helix domain-containing protein [Phreatobacter stygius]QCI67405.1 tetratricopeptide repeat protein [Phreatobacter stygius]